MDLDDEFDDGPYQGHTLDDVLSHAAGRRYVRDMIEDNEVFTGKPEKPRPSGRGGIGRRA